MSYQTGTATGPADLMSKLNTFLTGTPGWTADLYSAGNNRAIYSKAGVSTYIMLWWDSTNLAIAMIETPASPIDVAHTSHGGNEFTSSTITSVRYVNAITGPYPSYHFFEDDNYIHIVIEKSSGVYRHVGFGQLNKLGSWTGGTYCWGHYWDQGTSNIDNPLQTTHAAGPCGVNLSNTTRGAGIHVVGLPDMAVGTQYLRQMTAGATTDGDGEFVQQAFPHGWKDGNNVHFMALEISALNAFKPLTPIPWYQTYTTSTPDRFRLLGYIPDMRTVNLEGLNVGQEVTVGADTWLVFPITRKGNNGLSFNDEQSYNFGYAYKKVTT